MTPLPFAPVLDGLTRVPGVRSALVVDAVEGLVVAETSMEGVDAAAVAALAASLVGRLARAIRTLGQGEPEVLHLEGAAGSLMTAPSGEELLLVAVCEPDANLGLLRLALMDGRERLG